MCVQKAYENLFCKAKAYGQGCFQVRQGGQTHLDWLLVRKKFIQKFNQTLLQALSGVQGAGFGVVSSPARLVNAFLRRLKLLSK